MSLGVVSVSLTTPFKQIAQLLDHNRVSALPVVDDDHVVLGVVSESDLLAHFGGGIGAPPRGHRLSAHSESQIKRAGCTAGELMTSPAITVLAETPIPQAARIAARSRVHHLPVVDQLDALVGIVTRGDLLRGFLRPDDEIRSDIVAFMRDSMVVDTLSVDVVVDQGVVTLTGEMEREALVAQLMEHVEAVSGVVDVVDALTYRFRGVLSSSPLGTGTFGTAGFGGGRASIDSRSEDPRSASSLRFESGGSHDRY